MDYQQTIEYLYERLPMFSHIGTAAYKPDLENIKKLCDTLGNPQQQFKSIHVAGTNGKGSVSHMLAAIFQKAGYRTGLYTSPHLKDFRERIKVDGQWADESFIISFTERVRAQIENLQPSFFEITVAMAFSYFAGQKVDMAIIETGLGGRLDSTNIVNPELSIITNVGWDHTNILGNTLEQIATEKAGIIKSERPVVIGEAIPETRNVFIRTASVKKAPLTFAAEKRTVTNWSWEDHLLVAEIAEAGDKDHKVFRLDLPGIYQLKNLVTVLEAVSILRKNEWKITDQNIREALKQVKKLTGLHGRWDIIHTKPTVVLDVAHNPDGMAQLIRQVELTDHRQLHIIIGMVKDKDVRKTMALLPRNAIYYFTRASIPRAMPETALAETAHELGLKGKSWADVNQALQAALNHAHENDLILICGSVFLVGEVIPPQPSLKH